MHLLTTWDAGGHTGREWVFPGLQLGLFLLALAVLLDVVAIRRAQPQPDWRRTRDELVARYHLTTMRAVVLAAIPVVLAILAIGQMAVTGSGLEFVEKLLSSAVGIAG